MLVLLVADDIVGVAVIIILVIVLISTSSTSSSTSILAVLDPISLVVFPCS